MPRQKKLPAGMWKRGNMYYARFRKNGRVIRKPLSANLEIAKEALNDLKARADRESLGLAIGNNFKWSELRKEFLRWAKQSLRDGRYYERHLERFEEFMPLNNVQQVDQAHIVKYREWRLAQTIRVPKAKKRKVSLTKLVSPRTVNSEVGTIRAMLNKAVEWKRIGSNPIAGLEPLAHESLRKQRRALTVAEVESLFREAPAWLVPVLRLFATTGMRRNELVELRFTDVDFPGRCLRVRAAIAKNGKAREIPLDDDTLAMIRDLHAGAKDRQPTPETPVGKFSRDHVFVTAANTPLRNNLLRAFYAACKRAGIEGAGRCGSVDLHSLRVTFATLTIENGASPKAVSSVLGHSSLSLTWNVYAKATEKAKREAIGVLPFAKVQPPEHVLSMEQIGPEKRTAVSLAVAKSS